ncbi:MAG TPA: glycosyhydrolase, partial [Bacteroides clarus]|nr:glycosyhydrolase [Bacteroides clarus]
MKNIFLSFCLSFISLMAFSADRFIVFKPTGDCFPLATDGKPCPIIIDADEDPGVKIAVDNLQQDIFSVCGTKPEISTHVNSRYAVLVGTYRSPLIQRLLSSG